MSDTIFAWTDPGSNYPRYVNFSLNGDHITVTVRESVHADGSCGDVITVDVPLDAWKEFLAGHDLWKRQP